MHNGVALIGAGAGQTVIQGEMVDNNGILLPACPTVQVTEVDGFTLEGFTITDGSEGVMLNVSTDNVLVSKNIIYNNSYDNLLIYSAGSNVRVENNLISYSQNGSGVNILDFDTYDDFTAVSGHCQQYGCRQRPVRH